VEEQRDVSLLPQRAELLLEQRLFSQPIFYCQNLGEEAIRKSTCASLKCLFFFERKMADNALQRVYLDSKFFI